MIEVKITCSSDENQNIPSKGTPGSAGYDLVNTSPDTTLAPGGWGLFSTGIFLEIPKGSVGLICPRSGLAVKKGVTVLNAPGVIDSDYRGEIKVILINLSKDEVLISTGDRVAQILFSDVKDTFWKFSNELEETARGAAGFGSTGVGRA